MLACTTPSASAHEANKRVADANALGTTDAVSRPAPSSRRAVARAEKGPYYVDEGDFATAGTTRIGLVSDALTSATLGRTGMGARY